MIAHVGGGVKLLRVGSCSPIFEVYLDKDGFFPVPTLERQ